MAFKKVVMKYLNEKPQKVVTQKPKKVVRRIRSTLRGQSK